MPRVAEAPAGAQVRHLVVSVVTRDPVEFVDITPALARVVEGLGLRDGVLTVCTRHTTTGLLINEHEPLLFTDLQAMFERLSRRTDRSRTTTSRDARSISRPANGATAGRTAGRRC